MTFKQIFAFRARFIKSTLGTKSAAGYLRNRGVNIHDAVTILATLHDIR